MNLPIGRKARTTGLAPALAAAGILLAAAGCRDEMYDQQRYDPLEGSAFFDDGASARPIPAGTVARGQLRADPHYWEGTVDGADAETIPFPVDRAVLERGRQRYMIFCSPCHAATGAGDGMIIQRGFSPPPSFLSAEVRGQAVGHYYQVITKGHGAMYSYAARIAPRDRWAIAAYIRVLQQSQHAEVDRLPEADRKALEEQRP